MERRAQVQEREKDEKLLSLSFCFPLFNRISDNARIIAGENRAPSQAPVFRVTFCTRIYTNKHVREERRESVLYILRAYTSAHKRVDIFNELNIYILHIGDTQIYTIFIITDTDVIRAYRRNLHYRGM